MVAMPDVKSCSSLADRLAGLTAGDPCLCCGRPLDAEPVRPACGRVSAAESLICEDCGCRVDPVDPGRDGVSLLAYDLAA
jgi:hypothetical protein